MVWGGFCGSIKSELVFISGKAKLDTAACVVTVMEPIWSLHGTGAVGVWVDGVPGHKGHPKITGNLSGSAPMACTVTRPQPYCSTVGRHRSRVTPGLGKVSDLKALGAAIVSRRRDGSMLQAD